MTGSSAPSDGHRLPHAIDPFVEGSPALATEWTAVLGVLPSDPLTTLLGIWESSLRRYSTSRRPTRQRVAVRLHRMALRVADLAGVSTHDGTVRWWGRPRRARAGQSAADWLTAFWTPDDPRVSEVAELTADLTAMSAT